MDGREVLFLLLLQEGFQLQIVRVINTIGAAGIVPGLGVRSFPFRIRG